MTTWTLRRLARTIVKIFRIFRVRELIGSISVSGKATRRLSLLELTEQFSKARIDDRVRQRLISGESSRDETKVPVSSTLPEHVRQLLSSPPWTRTDVEIDEACRHMQKCSSFCDYQAHTQLILCRIGWYQRLEAGRVILKAGHPAGGLYFVLSGMVFVCQKRGTNLSTQVIDTIEEGSTFGEVSIAAHAKQATTCVSASSVEIFAIGRSDYIDLSLCQSRPPYQCSKHVSFCRTIGLLQFLPLHILDQQPGLIRFAYYKKGSVIVRNSTKNDWIYIVMNGVCQVVKMFVTAGTWQHGDSSNNIHGKGHLHSRLAKSSPRARRLLVQLQNLSSKDIFGLSRMLYANEPAVILVSRGAHVVLINKEFVEVHMHDAVKSKLQQEIPQYPSEDAILKRVKEHNSWSIYKDMLVKEHNSWSIYKDMLVKKMSFD